MDDSLKRGLWMAMGTAADAGPSKMARVGGAPGEEGWTCPHCGNANFAGRAFCNMRKCGKAKPGTEIPGFAPQAMGGFAANSMAGVPAGSWSCPDCGNVNFPTRDVCNGRNGRCGRPRQQQLPQQMQMQQQQQQASAQASSLHAVALLAAQAMMRSGTVNPVALEAVQRLAAAAVQGQVGGAAAAAAPQLARGAAPTVPEGSWVCILCKNVNYPTRLSCNAKNCGRPRAEVDGGPPGGFEVTGTASPNLGNWMCTACGNTNYPTRYFCNAKNCGRPRAEVDGGPAPAGLEGVGSQAPKGAAAAVPEGSWVCVMCQNVNFPTRTNCNGNSCGRPRAEVDGGPPAQLGMPATQGSAYPTPYSTPPGSAPPPDSWVCLGCNNVNYPTRRVCNGKSCGRPREEVDGGPPPAAADHGGVGGQVLGGFATGL